MTKQITYKIDLSEYYKQFLAGNRMSDSPPEVRKKIQNEINECIKDAVTVSVGNCNISRLDHKPIVVSVDDDTYGDWRIGFDFELGESAKVLHVINILNTQWIEITVFGDPKLAIMCLRK